MCDKDYNCYTECENEKLEKALSNGRSAGFHIHIGYDKPNVETSVKLIKYLDMYVGLPSILYDNDVRRRTLYGKAGSFRLTEYGLEFRTLSAAMYANETLMKIVWNGVMGAITAYNRCQPLAPAKLICKAIDDSDADLAKDIMATFNIRIIDK